MKTAYRVAMLHKNTWEGKEVVVQAGDKEEAEKKARGMQSFPRKWNIILAKPDACTMKTNFKHKGVRY
jgi:hypothetical protein